MVSWKPDPADPRILSVTRPPLQPDQSADVSFPGFVYGSGGVITSTVSLSNGDHTTSFPVTVAPPVAVPAAERDLPKFPQTITTHGAFIGGTGLDVVYGGSCSPGYVRSATPSVTVLETRGTANVELRGWTDPGNAADCRINVHWSITASFPSPEPNWVKAVIVIRERGA